ncbi:nucleophosmin-like isoform X2 [Pan troglodytes]|uniref:nucleophosmin-like isoform X2 n=1 Tax=Pan troglodytes TaxID=9598 RepID=UPI000D0A19F2|nr:nucleophosmin-like isoform X2 [Pan troglodytes]
MGMRPLRPQNYLFTVEEEAESEDEDKEVVKLLSISGKQSAPGGGSKLPQKKVKLAADEDDDGDDFDDKETEEKHQSNGQESFKKQQKTPETPKGPSSVEDIKAKMQASIEKGGSIPTVEAKFISYVRNCFQMSDQEAIQDLWQ